MSRYLFSALIIAVSLPSHSQTPNTHLDKFFIRKMEKANIAGMQVGYLSEGKLKWVGSYGFMDYSSGVKVNDSTLFMIASCSKPVTALGVMQLYDQGLINLDDDINKYLPFKISNPNFPQETITVRMLLTHTSSLQDDMDLLESLYTLDEGGDSPIELEDFIREYFKQGGKYYSHKNFTKTPPGKGKVYSNTGYALAGYLIQRITDKSFSKYMREEMFKPLDMKNSSWFLKEISHNNISLPHEPIDDQPGEYKVLKHYGYPTFPDGQLRTNVKDYSQILKLMLNAGQVNNKPFLKEKTIEEFLSIQFPETNKWQAIAWNYNEFDHWLYYILMPRLPSHTGVDPGVATITSFDPKRKTGVIILANTLTTNFKAHKIFYQEMVKKLLKAAKKKSRN